jgi:hypothetical protein
MQLSIFPRKTFIWITIFAISMGFLETTVVVYLRALLYPNGFVFPLTPIPQSLAVTEILRETATLIMLLGAGTLAGKNAISRFAWYLYAFAIWDIFYYIFLKLLLNWPGSLMTWDILFLIPVVWVGPVLAPVIISLTMIILSILIIKLDANREKVRINFKEWILLIAGSIILIIAFSWDYSAFILKNHKFSDIWAIPAKDMLNEALNYIPSKFNWLIFGLGEIIIISGIFMFWKRNRAVTRQK